VASPKSWWKWRPTSYRQLFLTGAWLFVAGAAGFYALTREWTIAYSYAAGLATVSTLLDGWHIWRRRRGTSGKLPVAASTEQTLGMRVASAILAIVAAALWLGWATRDYHDNQRNWLLWFAVPTTVLAIASVVPMLAHRVRGRG
jgi:hypothetical protein